MPDEDVERLIARIVGAARIPRRAARADLRRELRAHFEDAIADGATARDALRRFGNERDIVASLRRVHAAEYRLLYAIKIAAAMAASWAAALVLEVVVSLRLEPRGVPVAFAVVVAVAAAWELARPPVGAYRAARGRLPLLVMFGTFGALVYGQHLAMGVSLAASRWTAAAAALTLVAVATLAIQARFDRALDRFLAFH